MFRYCAMSCRQHQRLGKNIKNIKFAHCRADAIHPCCCCWRLYLRGGDADSGSAGPASSLYLSTMLHGVMVHLSTLKNWYMPFSSDDVLGGNSIDLGRFHLSGS